jgi:hypothetical protein
MDDTIWTPDRRQFIIAVVVHRMVFPLELREMTMSFPTSTGTGRHAVEVASQRYVRDTKLNLTWFGGVLVLVYTPQAQNQQRLFRLLLFLHPLLYQDSRR